MSKKLVIVGDSAFAEVAYEYFTSDSDYDVVGFSVETSYLTKKTLFSLPVVPFETMEKYFNPSDVYFYAALVYTQLNRLRRRLYISAKERGFRPASYISSNACVSHNATIGDHCFIFENNTIQPFVKIQTNVVLWSGNHIGHHSIVGEDCFIASHVVVSGFCSIGPRSFCGVNATIGNNVVIGSDNLIGAGAMVLHDTQPDQIFKGVESRSSNISAKRFFGLEED